MSRLLANIGPGARRRAIVPAAARHDEQVRSALVKSAVRNQPGAAAGLDHVLALERHERGVDVTAELRRSPKHLVRPDGVEFVESLEQEDCDVHTSDWTAPGMSVRVPLRGADKPYIAISNPLHMKMR